MKGETGYTKREPTPAREAGSPAIFAAVFSLWLLAKLCMSLAGAFALAFIFQRYAREMAVRAAAQPLMEIGRGLIFLIVLPVASVLFLITITGTPFGILGLLASAITLIFVSFAAPIVTGSVIHKWIWKPAGYEVNWKTVLLGVAVYFVLGLIPFLGWIVRFGIMLLALGAIINLKWSVAKEWR